MTDILVDDHAEVGELLRVLTLALDGGDVRDVLTKLDYVWARLAVHIRAEHLHLFPTLLAASEATAVVQGGPTPREVRESVERLREDHDFFMRVLAEAVNEARDLAAEGGTAGGARLGAIREGVLAVAGRLAEHNRLEEEQVYLWQAALLGEEGQAELRGRMRREIQNLPPRFSVGTSAG